MSDNGHPKTGSFGVPKTGSFAGVPPAQVMLTATPVGQPPASKSRGLLVFAGLVVLGAIIASVAVITTQHANGNGSSANGNGGSGGGTNAPTDVATSAPSATPGSPSMAPSMTPTYVPTDMPSSSPTDAPTDSPTVSPATGTPTMSPTTATPSTGTPTTLYPTKVPTTASPTSTPTTASPTNAPTTAAPTTPNPTQAPTLLADCTLLFGDLRDASAPFSQVPHYQAASGNYLPFMYDSGFDMAGETDIQILDYDMKSLQDDSYNIGPVSGRVYVRPSDAAVFFKPTVSNSADFYVKRHGGFVANFVVNLEFIDPSDGDNMQAFYDTLDAQPSSPIAAAPFPVYTLLSGGGIGACSSATAPNIGCSGPWNVYSYVEVCPKNMFATKAPTTASSPTPLTTAAPSTSSPLIDVVFATSNTSAAIVTAFENARDIWNDIITNTHDPVTLPAGTVDASALGCGAGTPFPAGTTEITGLTIFAFVSEIDGEGNVLGQAGPCAYSYQVGAPTVFGLQQPRLGFMEFDSADLDAMVADGTLERVILHEMGHVLGLGTLWNRFRQGHAAVAPFDPRYTGVNGVEGYQDIGGVRSSVPLANTGSAGTYNSHWRETTFADELMSGYASGPMPISMMTVKALKDLGYVVDETKAEAYTVPVMTSSQVRATPRKSFGDDIKSFEPVQYSLPGQ